MIQLDMSVVDAVEGEEDVEDGGDGMQETLTASPRSTRQPRTDSAVPSAVHTRRGASTGARTPNHPFT